MVKTIAILGAGQMGRSNGLLINRKEYKLLSKQHKISWPEVEAGSGSTGLQKRKRIIWAWSVAATWMYCSLGAIAPPVHVHIGTK